ncbi:MAG: molecular chaperone HtpG, partial [Lachnospiraceae bacterium]|nr:molecular chaperone HtpG [Lachnospiraceae bacterium]
DYILFKNLSGEYLTLPECLEVKPIDTEDEEASAGDGGSESGKAVDADGNAVEAEVVEADGEDADEDAAAEEKKEKTIYYVTDEQQQSQYINMFKKAKKDAVILNHSIDQPFVTQLESKNEGVRFMRIDADLTDDLKAKTSKKAQEELDKQTEELEKIFKKAIKKDNIKVKLEKLKNKDISSMLTVSEESRRMQDMMKMYSMPGMDMGMFGKEGQTLVLNANNKLVQKILEEKEGDRVQLLCEQLYDLALLQNAPLSPEAMTKFVARSNKIMMMLA